MGVLRANRIVRLQVFLSKAGVASRRAAAEIISSGKVSVNNTKIFEPSHKIDPEKDRVCLSNKDIFLKDPVYIMLHKPKGVTTTKKDRFAEKTVMELLPRQFQHLNPAGRLDKETTGLLLLTNDGELINRLSHPRYRVEKVYAVMLDKALSVKDKVKMETGIVLDGKRTLPCEIGLKGGSGLDMTLREGRKRQIRNMFSSLGYRVVDLKRRKEGFLELGALGEGKWRFLTQEEISGLRDKKITASS